VNATIQESIVLPYVQNYCKSIITAQTLPLAISMKASSKRF